MTAELNLEELHQLLAQENAAIMCGSYSTIDVCAERKKELFHRLHSKKIPQADLEKVSIAIFRNQALLAAAIQGIEAARKRIASLEEVRTGLKVYNQSGKIARVAVSKPDVIKKA